MVVAERLDAEKAYVRDVGILSLTDIVKPHSTLYANIKQLMQTTPTPLKEDVDFYVC